MIKVIYCSEGHHVSDPYALAYVDSVFFEYDFGGRMDIEIKVGNELILDAFVLRLMEKKFPANEIQFYDNKTRLEYNSHFGLIIPRNHNKTFNIHDEIKKQIKEISRQNIETDFYTCIDNDEDDGE